MCLKGLPPYAAGAGCAPLLPPFPAGIGLPTPGLELLAKPFFPFPRKRFRQLSSSNSIQLGLAAAFPPHEQFMY